MLLIELMALRKSDHPSGFDETPFPVWYDLSARELLPAILFVQDAVRQHGVSKTFKLSDLTSIQYYINPTILKSYQQDIDSRPITVGKINGKNLILDGTHRAAAAWTHKKTSIKAKFVDFGTIKTKGVTSDQLIKAFKKSL